MCVYIYICFQHIARRSPSLAGGPGESAQLGTWAEAVGGRTYVQLCMYVRVCIHIYIYIYVYTHTLTNIH